MILVTAACAIRISSSVSSASTCSSGLLCMIVIETVMTIETEAGHHGVAHVGISPLVADARLGRGGRLGEGFVNLLPLVPEQALRDDAADHARVRRGSARVG